MGTESIKSDGEVPWRDMVRFVRQLSHDLRNHLNAAELQSVFIAELTNDAELKAEIKRLREIISGMAKTLQKLSGDLGEIKPHLMEYGATDLMEDLRKKIGRDFAKESAQVKWDIRLNAAVLNVDPQLLQQVFAELFANAFQHDRGQGEILATAIVDSGRFVFNLTEPKTRFALTTDRWGHEPLRQVGHGHYGLGLNRARSMMEAHDGELRASYDANASKLVTTLTLPLAQAKR
jgi:K+-sensing histidine kinase KdpD